jgi:hydrogenase-4 membrane subunit HyfE
VNDDKIQLVEWLFFGFILIGIIIRLFSFNIRSELTEEEINSGAKQVGPATGAIWGYSIILFSTLGLIFISVNPQKENFAQIENIPLSLYGIVVLLTWCIILNFRFYDKINKTPDMPYQYDLWNNWSLITIIVLSIFCILEFLINVLQNAAYNGLKTQLRLFTIVVFFAGMIVIGIQDTILNNFLVDG